MIAVTFTEVFLYVRTIFLHVPNRPVTLLNTLDYDVGVEVWGVGECAGGCGSWQRKANFDGNLPKRA